LKYFNRLSVSSPSSRNQSRFRLSTAIRAILKFRTFLSLLFRTAGRTKIFSQISAIFCAISAKSAEICEKKQNTYLFPTKKNSLRQSNPFNSHPLKYFISFFLTGFFFSCGTAPKNGTTSSVSPLHTIDTASHKTIPRNPLTDDQFLGEARGDVKTSFVDVVPDTFASIKKLHSWLPDDEYMHKSTDAKHNNSPRTKEENHNIYLADLYIFGVKKEDDNDYHLILASSKKIEKDQLFFSAEISGLPDSSSAFFSTLSAVREKFLSHFGADANQEYVFVASEKNPPIHLAYIKGSLFFDNHHYGGHSSVKGFKVCSAWEIHPVTAIEFD
jgi:hypothetical protein